MAPHSLHASAQYREYNENFFKLFHIQKKQICFLFVPAQFTCTDETELACELMEPGIEISFFGDEVDTDGRISFSFNFSVFIF